jgi:uncharacterized repeat protein (TIGR03803 family)
MAAPAATVSTAAARSSKSRSGTLTTLYSFCSQTNCTDGYYPYAGLIQASDGNFYGTTGYGGANDSGTVFKITPQYPYTLTTLHSFDGSDGNEPTAGLVQASDGNEPTAGLVQASDGNFYGTTAGGGASGNCPSGCGTVFKITPQYPYTLTTLHSFDGGDGNEPTGGVVHASGGNFYGTTAGGGASGYGTVFKVTPSGTLTTQYSFTGSDGRAPYAGLVQATDGNFYGTTLVGGASGNCEYGCATVFKITPSGTLTTLYSFCSQNNCPDGDYPYAGLIQASDGNFYGTTEYGGAYCPPHSICGTVFKITPGGTLTTLYSFVSPPNDGAYPTGGLVQGTDGNLYGTAEYGGAYAYGTVSRLNALARPSPTSLNFGPQGLDIPNTPQTVTLTNTGGAPLLITNIGITGADSGDFSESNNCPLDPATLTPGGYCSITVVFSPTASGMRTADVTITDSAPDSPEMVPLAGVGVGGKVGLK